jgi:hypothetical protein
MLGKNHFAKPNQHVLTSLHPILICRVTYCALVELLLLLYMLSDKKILDIVNGFGKPLVLIHFHGNTPSSQPYWGLF